MPEEKKVETKTKIKNKLDITLGISLAVAFVLVLSILVSSGIAPIITGMAGCSGVRCAPATLLLGMSGSEEAKAEFLKTNTKPICSGTLSPFSYRAPSDQGEYNDEPEVWYWGVKVMFKF